MAKYNYSLLQKMDYYDKRMYNMMLTPGQRRHAKKRYYETFEAYNKMMGYKVRGTWD